jgi:hypothetical protein
MASILALMKLTKKKKRECYVRLFKMFESELKNFDTLFSGENYILNYIVCRDYFKGEDEISLIFKIYPNPSAIITTEEKYNLKQLLQSYSSIFSIKNITVIKSLRAEKEGKNYPTSELEIPKLEERIYFEYFRLIDKFVEV